VGAQRTAGSRKNEPNGSVLAIRELQWEFLEHSPYSPELAPSDFHLFGPLTNHFGGKCFADDEEIETKVWKWLRQESKYFHPETLNALVNYGTSASMLVKVMSRNKCLSQV
jgi:histone-lysine N-methyltransferase SETMAR